MGSGSSAPYSGTQQPCPNFYNHMPDEAVVPKETLALLTKSGTVIKSPTAAIIRPLRDVRESPESTSAGGSKGSERSKKQIEELREWRTISCSFLILFDLSLDGRLAPSAAPAPSAPATNAVAVGKGFNFDYVAPPPSKARKKKVIQASDAQSKASPTPSPSAMDADDVEDDTSLESSLRSVKSVLIHQSSFRGKAPTSSPPLGRTRSQRMAKIKVAQRTRYNVFNDSKTHEAWITFFFYYTAEKEGETTLLCQPSTHKKKSKNTDGITPVKVDTSRCFANVQTDVERSVLNNKVASDPHLKQESKDLFRQLPDSKGKVVLVTMLLTPGATLAVVESSEVQAYTIDSLLSPHDPKKSVLQKGKQCALSEVLAARARLTKLSTKEKERQRIKEYTLTYVSNSLDVDEELPSPLSPYEFTEPTPTSHLTEAEQRQRTSMHVEGVAYVDSPTVIRRGPSRRSHSKSSPQRRLGDRSSSVEPTSAITPAEEPLKEVNAHPRHSPRPRPRPTKEAEGGSVSTAAADPVVTKQQSLLGSDLIASIDF